MHRSLLSMTDMPLVSAHGLRLGEITDAYFDPFEQRVLAFAVAWSNEVVPGSDERLPITQLAELNADVATLEDELGASAGLDELPDNQEGWLSVFSSMIGLPVETASGQHLGKLMDLHFDPQDGSVDFYEVVLEGDGPLMVPPLKDLEVQPTKLVVPDAALRLKTHEGQRPELEVAFLEAEGLEDLVGEDDIEVQRSRTTQPY